MKRIIFVGGSTDGLARLGKYAEGQDYISIHKIETELPMCTEIEYTGMLVKNMLCGNTSALIISNVSSETRKLYVSEMLDQFKNLEVYRIWFNEYADAVPENYDIAVDPKSKHFEEILDKYFYELG